MCDTFIATSKSHTIYESQKKNNVSQLKCLKEKEIEYFRFNELGNKIRF